MKRKENERKKEKNTEGEKEKKQILLKHNSVKYIS
jgi:hypothetical protein